MIISITIRELDANKHITDRYAMISMYFKEKDKQDNDVRTVIIKKVHLMNDLKVNILIENEILDSELFDIFMSKSTTYIESCDVTISILITNQRSFKTKSVHSTRIKIIASNSEQLILIHKIFAFDRNYLFESSQTANVSVYAHMLDNDINSILIRNNCDKSIKIPRNFKLNMLSESYYINVFQIDANMFELALKTFKFEHKTSWFKKIFVVATAYAANVFNITQKSSFHQIEISLINDIIIHNSSFQAVKIFIDLLNEYHDIWTDQSFVKLSKENWMRLFLKTDWEDKIKEKVKVYSLKIRDREVVDNTFDELQKQNKLSYITKSTLFSFSCFVVWKESESLDKKKDRVVVDIRDLNAISQFDAYSIFLQVDVLQAVQNCIFISIIDCFEFFYQWKIHSSDKHKLIVVAHREQETFNVAVMSYRNSSFYIQRQIDKVLRSYDFAKAYIDDIVVYFKSQQEHFTHFRQIFSVLKNNNIFVNSKKIFIEYSSIYLLSQHVNSLKLAIDEQKLKTIAQLVFSKTLKQFEIYLNLTNWFRDYIKIYAAKFKSLQKRKTMLLKDFSKFDNARKFYSCKIKILRSTDREMKSFQNIQLTLFRSIFLIHFDTKRQLYIDLNFSKEKNIEAMMYHVRDDKLSSTEYSAKRCVQWILFFSRLLTSIEIRYWLTKLKIIELVWMLKKIRHFVESSKQFAIIYTDHETFFEIAK